MRFSSVIAMFAAGIAGQSAGQSTEFNFQGNAGFGLLPLNGVGANTPTTSGMESTATGGEVGTGLVYDADSNVLSFDFEFTGLNGGLFDAASGIHFHVLPDSTDPFNETGPIAFNLNSGNDSSVTLVTPLLATDGSVTGARVTGTASFTDEQESQLFASNYYLNIHSAGFTGGEIRGNLVPVPAPASAAVLGLGGLAACRRRR